MIRDGHPACRLKPASPAVPAASAKEENKKNNDDKRLGIHDVKPFITMASAWASPQYLPFGSAATMRRRGLNPPAEANYHNSFHGGLLTP
jgi:hypothetical protein